MWTGNYKIMEGWITLDHWISRGLRFVVFVTFRNDWSYDGVIKWKHFLIYWSFVKRIHRSPVDSPDKGEWHRTLFSLIWAWINGWVNNRDAGDWRRHGAHHVMHLLDIGAIICLRVITSKCFDLACLVQYTNEGRHEEGFVREWYKNTKTYLCLMKTFNK